MKKLTLLLSALMCAAISFAQVDEVTLTVLGTGRTEEEAMLQAFRSAIEQAFGAFVSANTSILNDKLVQDEIVSISNGNIKDYKKLAVIYENGHVTTSIKATVSIDKLVSYAKSKGSRAEFSGQTYSANLKLMQLRVSSTEKALNIMLSQLNHFAKDMFDFQISIGELQQGDICTHRNEYYVNKNHVGEYTIIPVTIDAYSNVASTNFYNLYTSTIQSLSLSDSEIESYKKAGIVVSQWRLPFSTQKQPVKTSISASLTASRPYIKPTTTRVVLPISESTTIEKELAISKMIDNAGRRYIIQEIGTHNQFKWVINSETGLYGSSLYSTELNRNVNDVRVDRTSITPNMVQTIGKQLKSLTAKEMREWKKGTYRGDPYETIYGPQTKLSTMKVDLYKRTSQMSNFNGYELLGVSAPTNVE